MDTVRVPRRSPDVPFLIGSLCQCMEAAFALLDLWTDYMHSTGHVRYAPDFFFMGTGFAAAFLLEVCIAVSHRRVVFLMLGVFF
jgi:hypothetical protein